MDMQHDLEEVSKRASISWHDISQNHCEDDETVK